MPKRFPNETVLHDWVCALPFQQQALLLTAMRGPDGNNKYNAAKAIIRYLRGVVIKPAGDWGPHSYDLVSLTDEQLLTTVGLNNNDFMWGEYDKFIGYAADFWEDHDEYPHHFIMHLVHCAEVVGYKHPNQNIRQHWQIFYFNACVALHMNPEAKEHMDERLNDFGQGVHNVKSKRHQPK